MAYSFPAFTSSDEALNVTYAYRCEVYQKHIKETPAGYVISEFLPDVPWAGIYNTISCAASHHFRDGRWLSDSTPLREYARFWCTEGNPRLYSFPIVNSLLALERVTGDTELTDTLYPALRRIHRAWDDHKTESGLYTQGCGNDGMEFSISGDGLRPPLNSYVAADTYGLAEIAARTGDPAAEAYTAEADALRALINERLWDESIGMFGTLTNGGEPRGVREQVGFIPWIYGLADKGRGDCFRYLLDPAVFLAKYGLRTADAGHPEYMKPFGHECLWNGPVWPFATSQTLTAMIEYLRAEDKPSVTPEDFMTLLLQYAASHRDTDGTPWIDENMDPDTGIWLAREIMRAWNRPDKDPTRGRHYNHSSFIDLVMTGVCGICPAAGDTLEIRPLGTSLDHFEAVDIPYRGHALGIRWSKTEGLTVTVDGDLKAACQPAGEIRATVSL